MSVSLNTRGATRLVLLTESYAIKIPRFWWYGHLRWESFLRGLLANCQERKFAATGWPQLCPVSFSLPGGWLLVMPRCQPCHHELTDTDLAEFDSVPVERKPDSFGYLNGRLVAFDYGS